MTPRHELFCKYYIKNKFNATKAAKKAGYSQKTAYSTGQKLLKKGEIQSKIKEYLQKEEKKLDYWRERLLEELSLLAFSDITNFLTVKDGEVQIKDLKESTPLSGAISSISQKKTKYSTSIKYKFWDKVRSLEAMARLLGMDVQDGENQSEKLEKIAEILKGRYNNGNSSGDK